MGGRGGSSVCKPGCRSLCPACPLRGLFCRTQSKVGGFQENARGFQQAHPSHLHLPFCFALFLSFFSFLKSFVPLLVMLKTQAEERKKYRLKTPQLVRGSRGQRPPWFQAWAGHPASPDPRFGGVAAWSPVGAASPGGGVLSACPHSALGSVGPALERPGGRGSEQLRGPGGLKRLRSCWILLLGVWLCWLFSPTERARLRGAGGPVWKHQPVMQMRRPRKPAHSPVESDVWGELAQGREEPALPPRAPPALIHHWPSCSRAHSQLLG